MKKLFAILFFVASSNSALAQSNFDAIYLGIAAGKARGEDKGLEYKDNGATHYNGKQRTNPQGNLYGVFLGGNKVVNKNILLGGEIDYEKRNYSHASYQMVDNAQVDLYPIETKLRDAASLRARLGYIFNNDKTLSYLTGGLATISIKRSYGYVDGTPSAQAITTRHDGYTIGAGLEHFICSKISLRGEYRYTRYSAKNSIDASQVYNNGTVEKQRFRDQSFRVGVALNF